MVRRFYDRIYVVRASGYGLRMAVDPVKLLLPLRGKSLARLAPSKGSSVGLMYYIPLGNTLRFESCSVWVVVWAAGVGDVTG